MLYALTRPSFRVLWQECQPDTVDYGDQSRYCLYVMEGSINWDGFPYTVQRDYHLLVSRGEQTSYGHYLDYRFTDDLTPFDEYLVLSSTDWTLSGVTFREYSGHRLFIPAELYLGGR